MNDNASDDALGGWGYTAYPDTFAGRCYGDCHIFAPGSEYCLCGQRRRVTYCTTCGRPKACPECGQPFKGGCRE